MPARIEWVKARRNGKTLFIDGQARSSRHDPVEEARRLLENAILGKDAVLIFLGLPPAYHILQAALEGRPFLVVEAHPELRSAGPSLIHALAGEMSLTKPLSFWTENFVSASAGGEAAQEVQRRVGDVGKIAILENPTSPKSDEETSFYDAFKVSLKNELLDEVKRRVTEIHFAKRWVRNAVENIIRSKKVSLLSDLKVTSQGSGNKTALLISSGPSVEEDLPILCESSKYFATFALPGVFPLLIRNNISVDVLLSTDGGYYNSCHFEAISRSAFKGMLIAPFSIYPSIPEGIEKTFFYFDDTEWADLLAPKLPNPPTPNALQNVLASNWIPMAGSAVVNAVQILYRLGFTKVLTSGIDFALSPFKVHAISNITEERFFSENTRFQTFENKYHRTFPPTDDKLKLYQRLFQKEVERMNLTVLPVADFHDTTESSKKVNWETSKDDDHSQLLKKSLVDSLPSLEKFFANSGAWDVCIPSKLRSRIGSLS